MSSNLELTRIIIIITIILFVEHASCVSHKKLGSGFSFSTLITEIIESSAGSNLALIRHKVSLQKHCQTSCSMCT